MIQVRRSHERGHAQHGWLDSHHTFSFGNYYDPNFMGFQSLRVINEDRVEPGAGFPTHPHRDMEIVSYVIAGALEHKDSMGHGSIIRPGDVQRMSAGTGVTHSEFNPSPDEPVRFLQIWLLPEAQGLQPGYEQKSFPKTSRTDQLRLVASRDGRDGSVTVHQNVDLYSACLNEGRSLTFPSASGRHLWLQVVEGELHADDVPLKAGDGAALVTEGRPVQLESTRGEAHFLLFDLG